MSGTIEPMPGTLTYDDLASYPDDGLRRELIDGELLVSPSPVVRHQQLVLRLAVIFDNYIKQRGGGRVFIAPLDVLLSNRDVVEPDVLFVADSQPDIVTVKNIVGVPALLIEVLSEPRVDRVRKRDLYARFAVPEYWIVDPDADRVEVYRFGRGSDKKPRIFEPGEILTYDRLSGLSIELHDLFAR